MKFKRVSKHNSVILPGSEKNTIPYGGKSNGGFVIRHMRHFRFMNFISSL